ncbi:MAG: ZIP family metal transporter [Candidatus Peregrinibacteria bacterium]|nr:ZIP family metal transporter [Candidatus Peregrinibacteria bacterium]
MLEVWTYSLISVLVVSLISLLGILSVAMKRDYLKGFLLFMVSFAAGALLGDVFFHLLPELIAETGFSLMTGAYILLGILIFFVLEKIMHWRHCHMAATEDHAHPLAVMNLVGDAFHNFIDGVVIAGTYLLSIPVGIATTVAVIFHEIPQEMGDFGVLLHSGMKTRKALFLNFVSALASFLGVILILGLNLDQEALVNVVIPISIGGFLYIANADLIPELHKDVDVGNSLVQLLSLVVGIGLMAALLFLPFNGEGHGSEEPETGSPYQFEELDEKGLLPS